MVDSSQSQERRERGDLSDTSSSERYEGIAIFNRIKKSVIIFLH